jgi:hypothetical protein
MTERAEVVDAAHVVIMDVGDEHGVNGHEVRHTQHLFAEVGSAVNEDAHAIHLHQTGTAGATVTRI